MKKGIILLSASLLLLSCESGRNQRPYQHEEVVDEVVDSVKEDTCNVKEEVSSVKEEEPKKDEGRGKTEKVKASSSSASPSSSRSHKSSSNNMRGFDPASEDDMDDNGISRYMENNDDEGWD